MKLAVGQKPHFYHKSADSFLGKICLLGNKTKLISRNRRQAEMVGLGGRKIGQNKSHASQVLLSLHGLC